MIQVKGKQSVRGRNSVFSERLRKTIEEKETTQKALADAIGVTRQSVQMYCDGRSEPGIERLGRIAATLGVTSDYLLGLTNASSIVPELRTVQDITGLDEPAIRMLCSLYLVAKDRYPSLVIHAPIDAVTLFLADSRFSIIIGELCKCANAQFIVLTDDEKRSIERNVTNACSKLGDSPEDTEKFIKNTLHSEELGKRNSAYDLALFKAQQALTAFIKDTAEVASKGGIASGEY
jgi:transcriptional regulator with XRE-family HTH domain